MLATLIVTVLPAPAGAASYVDSDVQCSGSRCEITLYKSGYLIGFVSLERNSARIVNLLVCDTRSDGRIVTGLVDPAVGTGVIRYAAPREGACTSRPLGYRITRFAAAWGSGYTSGWVGSP